MTILTERDKKLLYILGVMVVLALGAYLLVLPAYNGYVSQQQQLDAANAEYDRQQELIASADVTQASISQLRQKLIPELAGYPSVMHNLELDRRHTLRAVMQQWKPTKLDIQSMAPLELVRFGTTTTEDGETVEPVAGSTAWLAASSISMAADARQSDAITLIDTIVNAPAEQLETLKITPMNIEVQLDEDGKPIVQVNDKDPYLTIEMTTWQFYSLNQQTPEVALPGLNFQ